MSSCLLIYRSLTHAQRAKKALERRGVQATVTRPNLNLTGGDCGYAVRVSEVFLAEALEILRQHGARPQKVFVADAGKRYREMPL